MRHRNKLNHLNRPAGHRKALLMNLSKSLVMHKRMVTTLAKAKALRKFIEPILSRAKQDTTHARRMVFSQFQDKEPVKELFNNIAEKIGQRPGGYTRIIKLGNRAGDNARMGMVELVDYNEVYTKAKKIVKTTRRRRKKSATPTTQEIVAGSTTQDPIVDPTTQEIASEATSDEE